MNPKVWLLALGRFLSQIGSGFTLFYAPIFFVNEVGISATSVGIALGSASISGVFGRFLGGSLSDSPTWGRRKILLISSLVSGIACFVFAISYDFTTLIISNLLLGFGVGLFWPAAEAAIADLSTLEQRTEAFAINRLADNLGLGLGVVLGGLLISLEGSYASLFIIDGISFFIFLAVIYFAIPETYKFPKEDQKNPQFWREVLSDRPLWVYVGVNILFTTYLAQIQSTMPLYLKNFLNSGGLSPKMISAVFTFHIIFAAIFQLPVARYLNRYSHSVGLIISMLLWGIGFILVWFTGVAETLAAVWAFIALGVLGLATVSYNPSASALVVELAPESMRGVYLAINSQCWAIGYFIGPPLGGWVLDQPRNYAHNFWLACAASITIGILILRYLETTLKSRINIKS